MRAADPERRMECHAYGCVRPDRAPAASGRPRFDKAACGYATAEEVMRRICGRIHADDEAYQHVRVRFLEGLRKAIPSATLEERLRTLREQSEALERRAIAQPSWPSSRYARREWQRSSPTARLSCKDCVGDVVPEFDLGGCWPLWPQFAPDELQFECKRNWTIPPEYGRKQHRDREVPPVFQQPPLPAERLAPPKLESCSTKPKQRCLEIVANFLFCVLFCCVGPKARKERRIDRKLVVFVASFGHDTAKGTFLLLPRMRHEHGSPEKNEVFFIINVSFNNIFFPFSRGSKG